MGSIHLGILCKSEPRFGGIFRETEARERGRDDMEARVFSGRRREQREHLLHLEEVARP
jgi:hypothetical protein